MLARWISSALPISVEVIAGLALYDFIQTLRRKGHKVTTVSYGMAASMAGILLQAGDVRVMG